MKRLDSERARVRGGEASPVTYAIGIPLAEMLLASLGVALAIGLLSWWGGADLVGAVSASVGVFVLLVAVLLAVRFGKAFLWGLERFTGVDLDGDQIVGKPGHDHHFVYVRGGARRNNSELLDLEGFVRGCYTRGPGRRLWLGSRLPGTGHTVTRGMYDKFCDILLQAGILEDLGEGRGKELACSLEEALASLDLL